MAVEEIPNRCRFLIFNMKFLLRFSQDDLSNDPELAGKYIVLTRVDGHASWVSKPVLELMVAGGKIPESVGGGEIIRDKDGIPTGKEPTL